MQPRAAVKLGISTNSVCLFFEVAKDNIYLFFSIKITRPHEQNVKERESKKEGEKHRSTATPLSLFHSQDPRGLDDEYR